MRPVILSSRRVPVATRLNHEGEVDGSQWHHACFSDRVEFRTSHEFYRQLLPFLGMKPIIDTYMVYPITVSADAPRSRSARRQPEYAGAVRSKSRRPAPSLYSRPQARRHSSTAW